MKRGTFASASLLALCALRTPASAAAAPSPSEGSQVRFNEEGITLVNGKPFFPVGMFTYELNPEVMAELHELQCNTILHGFQPNQLDAIHDHGLMAVCTTGPEWLSAAQHHPAMLAWYLEDEPENRGISAGAERQRYLDLKKQDPDHPIGLCHTSFEALSQFKNACDFTMTDIYPITAKRDKNVMGVSVMMDEARRIHGANWPQWTFIQVFGGEETDNGVWAVPLPHEVRFMAYQALVHRATGILYFSFWSRQQRTWQSVATLNHEIQRLVPRLVAPGKELPVKMDTSAVHVRARLNSNGASGVVIAINTSPRFLQATISVDKAPANLSRPFEGDTVGTASGQWIERFPAYGVHVYTWGPDPLAALAGESAVGN
jgi:hypothetical protein